MSVKVVTGVLLGLCSSAAIAGDAGGGSGQGLLKRCTPDEVKQHPERCDHQVMLKNGSSLYTVYMLHAQKKYDLAVAEPGMKNTSGPVPPERVKDGTCASTDATVKDCLNRLQRLAVDARIQAREQILRQNNGRAEIMNHKDDLMVSPSSSGATADKTTILKDLSEEVKKDPKTQAYQLLAQPHPVDFNTPSKVGDGLLMKNGPLQKSQTVDVQNINSDIAGTMQNGSKFEAGDASAASGDSSLSGVVASQTKLIKSEVEKDQKANDQIAKDVSQLNKQGQVTDSLSARALEETMKDLAKSEGSGKGKTGDLSVLDEKDANVAISDPNSVDKGDRKPGSPAGATGSKAYMIDKEIKSGLSAITGQPSGGSGSGGAPGSGSGSTP